MQRSPCETTSDSNDRVAVRGDPLIVGHQSQRFHKRLRNQDAVERVVVQRRQGLQRDGVLCRDAEQAIASRAEVPGGVPPDTGMYAGWRACLMAISHTLAALTDTPLPVSAMSWRAARGSFGLFVMAHSTTWMSSSRFTRRRH